MTKISLYPEISTPDVNDLLIGTDVENSNNATKNFTIDSILSLGVETNTTTTALSLSALNIAYPDAIAGFKVQCISITAGKLIYEKTSTGWVSYSVTLVS
jgi:hypothetical protein